MAALAYQHSFSEEERLFSLETLEELEFKSITGFNLKVFH